MRYTILLLLFSCALWGQTKNDSIFCNINNPNKDRVLLFGKKYFIRINQEVLGNDTLLIVAYGNYHYLKDTIYFSFPDTVPFKNKFFCYCKSKYDSINNHHLINKRKKERFVGADNIYNYIFKTTKPNLMEI
jgi:hypothetical protein